MEIKCILSAAVLELVLRRNFSVKNEERQTPHKQPKKTSEQKFVDETRRLNLSIYLTRYMSFSLQLTKLSFKNQLLVTK